MVERCNYESIALLPSGFICGARQLGKNPRRDAPRKLLVSQLEFNRSGELQPSHITGTSSGQAGDLAGCRLIHIRIG